jgi:hypothetical protein
MWVDDSSLKACVLDGGFQNSGRWDRMVVFESRKMIVDMTGRLRLCPVVFTLFFSLDLSSSTSFPVDNEYYGHLDFQRHPERLAVMLTL